MKLLLIFLSTIAFAIAQDEMFNQPSFYYHLFNGYIEPSFTGQCKEQAKDWTSDEDSRRGSNYFRNGAADNAAARYVNGNNLLKTLFLYTTLTRTVTSATSCIPLSLFSNDKGAAPYSTGICRRKRRELLTEVPEQIDDGKRLRGDPSPLTDER